LAEGAVNATTPPLPTGEGWGEGIGGPLCEACDRPTFARGALRSPHPVPLPKGEGTLAVVLVILLAVPAFAATRGRYGGTLKVAFAARQSEVDPLLADSPAEATLTELLAQPLC